MNNDTTLEWPLMPINKDFLKVFGSFMDETMENKHRANDVRQYVEGIIDLLLKEKILDCLGPNQKYEGTSWKNKLKYIKKYDEKIGNSIAEIFRVGGAGSHFAGRVSDDELEEIIKRAIHIVEDIFVRYFLSDEHRFGNENIYTIFSMLPLRHRIYILEHVSNTYTNQCVIDRLSLAYAKAGEMDKAVTFLKKQLQEKNIDCNFYDCQLYKITIISEQIEQVYELNKDYENNHGRIRGINIGSKIVVGLPPSKDVFNTAKAVNIFKSWFDDCGGKYPEFIKLFLYLMQTDDRQYN